MWNLFFSDEKYGKGLKNAEYAPLCEIMGRSRIGPHIFNCSAPDTGNMEILAEFGTPEQKRDWLEPCLEGKFRSCFSMTEPETPGSDPTQLRTRAVRDGDDYVINGHKWFTSGALHSKFAIAMVVGFWPRWCDSLAISISPKKPCMRPLPPHWTHGQRPAYRTNRARG